MKRLVIQEKYSKYWPTIALASLLLSIALFISYQLMSDVLWIGYVRLASFGMFALALLSFFKVRDGQVEISIECEEDIIRSTYTVQKRLIYQTESLRSDFDIIKVDEMPNKSLYNDIVRSDKCVIFKRKGDDTWYYFNQIDTRVIPLNEQNALKLQNFLEENSVSS